VAARDRRAELSWEIQRYRRLRHTLLETYRQKAIEAALRRIDMIGIAPEFEDEAEYYTLQNALSWRIDPMAATEIDARLATYGFDQHAITAEVYVQARELFVLFEGPAQCRTDKAYAAPPRDQEPAPREWTHAPAAMSDGFASAEAILAKPVIPIARPQWIALLQS
jgi:hypothetical protein